MRRLSLKTKILLSVGLIIFLVLGTSTIVHVRNLKKDYLEALTWRSEALAYNIINDISSMRSLGLDKLEDMFPPLALRCIKLYELNKNKNVTHFAVIDPSGIIGPHTDSAFWNTPVTSPVLKEHLQHQQQVTVLDGTIYHTLVPVFEEQGRRLATIDVGMSGQVVDQKIRRIFFQAVVLFAMFLLLAFFMMSFLMHALLTKPVRQLVLLGQQLAAGNLVHIPQAPDQGDEVTILTSAFCRISLYLQHVAEVATAISTGDLRGQVAPRSDRDVLGIAFQRMTAYLDRLSSTASTIAGGNLHQDVQPESEHDVLGNAFHAMAIQLRENFEKIQQEIAERTRAQEALQKLNEELEQRVEERTAELTREKYILETFMNTVPDKIYFKDLNGRITGANKAHALGFGFRDPSEETGKTDFDLLPENLARMTHEQELEIIRTGEPLLDRELPIPLPNGNVRWSLMTKMPLRDENGEIIGTFGVSRDITSQKQTQNSLERAYSEILSLNHQLQEDMFRYYTKALLLGSPTMSSATNIQSTVRETWHAPYFCVILIKILPGLSELKPTSYPRSRSRSEEDILIHLRRIYERHSRHVRLSGMFFLVAEAEAALILNPHEEDQIHALCSCMATESTSILQDHASRLAIGIGDIVTTPDDLHRSYDTAQQAIFARNNAREIQILSSSDVEQRKRESLLLYFPVEKEQQLITAVIAGQRDQVQDLLHDLIAQNNLEHSNYQKLMTLYNHFLQTAGKILAQAPVQDTGTSKSSLLQTFRATKPETIHGLNERVREVFGQLLNLYYRRQSSQADALTRKLFRYLERHYKNPNISLDSLAEVFSLNPSYLSRYFKEQSGMNYVEYLALLRVKNAKNLLVAYPGQKIQEIGLKVGFSGKESFIRTFKRFEGVTPGTYRKRALSRADV